MDLAGGFRKGDRVMCSGTPATVLGPPSRPAAAKVSVAVRLDDGMVQDARISSLQAGAPESPSKMSTGRPTPARPKTRSVLNSNRVLESSPPPDLFVGGSHPSKNFIQCVHEKDPLKDEADAPDTQTIVRTKAKYTANLSTDKIERQKELVRIYTMETQLYPQMNLALRQDDPKRLRYFGSYIKELRDVFLTDHIDQIITPFVGTCYRGITVPDVDAFLRDLQPDMEFVWPSFTSTTDDKMVARIFGNVMFEIHCREPVTGSFDDDIPEYAPAAINQFSEMKEESEILFPPNVRFRVISLAMPTGGLGCCSIPTVICETLGYDSIWGLIDSRNYSEVEKWCAKNDKIHTRQGLTHCIVDHALRSGDQRLADAVTTKPMNGSGQNVESPNGRRPLRVTRFSEEPEPISPMSPLSPMSPVSPSFERPQQPFPTRMPRHLVPDSPCSGGTASPSRGQESLPGGFLVGERVQQGRRQGIVLGPASRPALRHISVSVRFDDCAPWDSLDIRVAQLQTVP